MSDKSSDLDNSEEPEYEVEMKMLELGAIRAEEFLDKIDMPDCSVTEWLKKNSWFDPSSDDYDSELSLRVRNYSECLEAEMTEKGLASSIMSKEYFDEIDKFIQDFKTEKNRHVVKEEVDDWMSQVDPGMSLFNLQAPQGWEYFLGREFEHWRERSEDGCLVAKQQRDDRRIAELRKNGWTAVPADRYPQLDHLHADGALRYRGLILLERPKAVGDKARAELEAVNAEIIKSLGACNSYSGGSIYKTLDFTMPNHIKEPKLGQWEEKKSWTQKIFSFFKKKKERHYYTHPCRHSHYLLFPKARKLIETIQFKFRFGKYKLDWEEKDLCQRLKISEESYIQEKYKMEMSSIY